MSSLRVILGINTQVRALFKASIHDQLLCSLNEFGEPSLGLSDENSCDYVKTGGCVDLGPTYRQTRPYNVARRLKPRTSAKQAFTIRGPKHTSEGSANNRIEGKVFVGCYVIIRGTFICREV